MELLARGDVQLVVADQCQYGLTAPTSKGGERLPALKPTKFMTNAPPLAALLQQRCDRSHKHQALEGNRCAAAAFYPLGLIRAIVVGMKRTMDWSKKGSIHAMGQEAEVEIEGLKVSSISRTAGGKIKVIWDYSNFKACYKDEYTQDELPQQLIKEAIIEELSYFNDHVWEAVTMDEMRTYKDWKLVRSRWVLCNKGDHVNPECRARLVACEVNKANTKEEAFFAATPPLEAKKALFMKYALDRPRLASQCA